MSTDEIFFDGTPYISAVAAAQESNLTRDYIARLCREGRIRAKRVGKNWYVDHPSLKSFLVEHKFSLDKHRAELARERAHEYRASVNKSVKPSISSDIRSRAEAVSAPAPDHSVPPRTLPNFKEQVLRKFSSRNISLPVGIGDSALRLATHATTTLNPLPVEILHKLTALLVALSLTVGTYAMTDAGASEFAKEMMRSTALAVSHPSEIPLVQDMKSQLAAVLDPAWPSTGADAKLIGKFMGAVKNFARLFNESVDRAVYAIAFTDSLLQLPNSLSEDSYFAGSGTRASVAVRVDGRAPINVPQSGTSVKAPDSSKNVFAGTTIINNNPVVERVLQTERVVAMGGISEDVLNQKINQLDNKLTSKMFSLSAANSTTIAQNYVVTAHSNKIDQLNSVSVSNSVISGGSISGSTISATTLSASDFSASNATIASTTVTGNLTVDGSILLSDDSSSISATDAVFTNATTTNFFATNASTTNATSTNLFSVLGHFTTAVIDTLTSTLATITGLTATNFIATNATTTNATSTNLAVTGLASLGTTTITNLSVTNTSTSTFAGGFTIANSGFVYQQATGRIGIGTTTPGSIFDIYGTDALRLPVGNTAQRPSQAGIGQVRYNMTTHQFEGYGDNAVWQGLGGVIDADQDTYVTADTSNSDEDTLRFFTLGSQRMTITNAGNVGIASTSPFAKFAIHALSGETNSLLFEIASSTASATTSLFKIDNTGLTTLLNLVGTNATTTNFFSTTASSTNLYSTSAAFGVLSANSAAIANGFLSNASSTITSGLFSMSGGASTTNLTASGISWLDGGLLALASSTIGAGGQTTGLTISGGATTTGNQYIAGTLGIGAVSLNASASLQIDSTTKGFLPPRMTTVQKNAIGSPAGGLVLYDSDLNKLNVYNGSAWKNVGSTEIAGEVTSGTAGSILFIDTGSSGSVLAQDNASFNYSSSTHRLLITNASSTLFSNFGTAYFGGSATTTIDSAGNLVVAGNTTLANATTTNLFSTTASSTNLFSQTATLGTLTLGNALAVTSGGTGATSLNNLITLGDHTTGNYVATLANAGGLTIANSGSETAGVTAALNMGNSNFWTALQSFANASSTLFSNFGTAYFGGSATTTIDSSGNLMVMGSTTLQNFTAANATTTNLFSTTASSTNLFSNLATVGTLAGGSGTFSGSLTVNGLCVTGDTKLRRRRRRKDGSYEYDEPEIVDIEEGDEIQSLDEKTGRLVWSRVKQLAFMGVKDIFKITTASGKTIRTTGNHPYLIRDVRGKSIKHVSQIEGAGWVVVTNMTIGDAIAVAGGVQNRKTASEETVSVGLELAQVPRLPPVSNMVANRTWMSSEDEGGVENLSSIVYAVEVTGIEPASPQVVIRGLDQLTPTASAFYHEAVASEAPSLAWDIITSIEKLPAEDVYDIEVEGTHNFIGNDIVAHNTAFFQQASTTLLSAYGAFFGATATSSFSSTGALTLAGITNSLLSADGSGTVGATTTPTAQYFIATSSTIASTFPYAS
ncbi:MAG: hypothetical protein Q7S01_00970, partial [bacterium]|nr:hypothetical protein [bacterium]